ncbi:MAG TPA: hypothetical protein VF292_03145 [Rhodanobacteraceae bacterium]
MNTGTISIIIYAALVIGSLAAVGFWAMWAQSKQDANGATKRR